MLTVCRPDDDIDVVYLAPEVYEGTPAQCTGPCQLVFPPRPLGSTTTISLQPYTTSIQLKPGVTTTLTVSPPPIVTDLIEYYNVNITSDEGTKTITPIASVTIVPVTTTITLQGGETQVRTLTLPPWPAISGIPTGGQGTGTGRPTTTRTKTIATQPTKPANTGAGTTRTPIPFPSLTRPLFPTVPGTRSGTEPTKTWPAGWDIFPVETEVPEEGDEDGDDHDFFYVSCKLWFFSVRRFIANGFPFYRPQQTNNHYGRYALIGPISVSRSMAGSGTCLLGSMDRKLTLCLTFLDAS